MSVGPGGVQGDGDSFTGRRSRRDGRFVAFASDATNLVAGRHQRHDDVFVRDRQTGTTERVSVELGRRAGRRRQLSSPSISADGRFVAFTSDATNLVPGDTNGTHDVFVRDRQRARPSGSASSSSGAQANWRQRQPGDLGDGRFVAFESDATNLVPGDTNGVSDVFVRDRKTGTTQRVSVELGGVQGERRQLRARRSRRTGASSPSSRTPPTWCRAT